MRSSIRQSLYRGKGRERWQKLVGYSLQELKVHLEKQFQSGMMWENYGEWQIDHIIPIAAFNFQTRSDIDFKRCWSLMNLRPLWAKENYAKHDKLCEPFQPSLAIGA